MKILIFTEGTVIMHSSARGLTREEIAKQVENSESSVKDYRNYIPSGNVVEKLNQWKSQGAEIYYLTSRTTPDEVADIQHVLETYSFPDKQNLLFRKEGEEYQDVAEKLMPDVLVEDDCESIGGEQEMTYTNIRQELKPKIKQIIVKEFEGIDHLPSDFTKL